MRSAQTGVACGSATTLLAGAFVFGVSIPASAAGPVPSFDSTVIYNTPIWATDMTSADLNGDGYPDIINAIGSTPGEVSVLVNNGTAAGTFATVASYPTSADVTASVAVADFNRDGDLDVVAGGVGGFSTLLGDGSGGLGAPSVVTVPGSEGKAISAGDLNGDGYPDVVVSQDSDINRGTIAVVLNDRSGGFGAVTTLALSAQSAPNITGNAVDTVLTDINGDGSLDIVVDANGYYGQVVTFINNGSGTFPALGAATPVSNGSPQMATGDVNGDGNPDIVLSNIGNPMQILLGNGSGGWSAAANIGLGLTETTGVNLTDINGDGFLDLLIGLYESVSYNNEVGYSLGDGSGGFGPVTGVQLAATQLAVLGADVNLDGRPDISSAAGNGQVAVLLNTTTFASPTATGSGTGPEAGGTVVTINGTNLASTTQVTFGSTPATNFEVSGYGGTQLKVTSPAGTGTQAITVTTPGGTAVAGDFVYGGVGPTPPIPPNPPAPTPGLQDQIAKCATLPAKLPLSGTKRVVKARCVTNAGNKITVTATAKRIAARGDVMYVKVVKGAKGKQSVRTYGKRNIRITVTMKAPASPGYRALRASKSYLQR